MPINSVSSGKVYDLVIFMEICQKFNVLIASLTEIIKKTFGFYNYASKDNKDHRCVIFE